MYLGIGIQKLKTGGIILVYGMQNKVIDAIVLKLQIAQDRVSQTNFESGGISMQI